MATAGDAVLFLDLLAKQNGEDPDKRYQTKEEMFAQNKQWPWARTGSWAEARAPGHPCLDHILD